MTRKAEQGQAALSLTFLIGGIILFIGITLAFLAITFLNSTFGFQNANKALALAVGGANDALTQLTRNKDFSDTSGYCVPASCGTTFATVTVTQNSPSAGFVKILSWASISGYKRQIQIIVSVNATTGQVAVVSWKTL